MKRKYTIEMEDLELKDVEAIELVLENCESVKIYCGEIIDINFNFSPELIISGDGVWRKIKSGYVKFKFDDKKYRHREVDFIGYGKKKPKSKDIMSRLIEMCDICYIVVTYKVCYRTENIEVPYEDIENEKDEIDLLECPTAKIDEEGNFLILFGELSEWKSGQ